MGGCQHYPRLVGNMPTTSLAVAWLFVTYDLVWQKHGFVGLVQTMSWLVRDEPKKFQVGLRLVQMNQFVRQDEAEKFWDNLPFVLNSPKIGTQLIRLDRNSSHPSHKIEWVGSFNGSYPISKLKPNPFQLTWSLLLLYHSQLLQLRLRFWLWLLELFMTWMQEQYLRSATRGGNNSDTNEVIYISSFCPAQSFSTILQFLSISLSLSLTLYLSLHSKT